MKKPTPAPAKAAAKKPAAKKAVTPKAKAAAPVVEPKPSEVDPETLKPADEGDGQDAPLAVDDEPQAEAEAEAEFVREVAEGENDTLVIDPADARDGGAPKRVPTQAELHALRDHIELRVTELVTYVKAEAAKFGADPRDLAGHIAEQVHRAL